MCLYVCSIDRTQGFVHAKHVLHTELSALIEWFLFKDKNLPTIFIIKSKFHASLSYYILHVQLLTHLVSSRNQKYAKDSKYEHLYMLEGLGDGVWNPFLSSVKYHCWTDHERRKCQQREVSSPTLYLINFFPIYTFLAKSRTLLEIKKPYSPSQRVMERARKGSLGNRRWHLNRNCRLLLMKYWEWGSWGRAQSHKSERISIKTQQLLLAIFVNLIIKGKCFLMRWIGYK